ncbi:hypothetical protein [Flavobacterium tegetincola]|uniref:hypothetical protein n=1 Tax=Flavobacterium tegetincola TaxID=150172 RepID=UPI00040944F1|nr:hypothetical protein [Flavobacterium tegetincola]
MKIYYLLFLLFTTNSFSQSVTEKWNNLNNRYEYFDSYGNMKGYKKYNSVKKQWEYYDLNNSNKYVPPELGNIELARSVLKSRQTKYDANYKRIKETASSAYKYFQDYIASSIKEYNEEKNSDKSSKLWMNMFIRYHRDYDDVAKNNGYDYSSMSTTNNVIDWLNKGAEYIAKDEIQKEIKELQNQKQLLAEKNSVPALQKFIGRHHVKSVEEFKYVSGKWVLHKTDVSKTEFIYGGDYLGFKRSYHSEFVGRPIQFLYFDSNLNSYQFNSDIGKVFISPDFKKIIIYDPENYGEPTNKFIYNL